MPRKRTERAARKIAESRTGRILWTSGMDHPLDVLAHELEQLTTQLPGQLETLLTSAQRTTLRLRTILDSEQQREDRTEPFTAADHKAHQLIVDRFANRKHLYHLQICFALQRKKRLLGRLHAIQSALDLVNGLLDEEETLSAEFLQTWMNTTQTNETPGQQDAPSVTQAPPEIEPSQTPHLTKEEMRLQNITEPLTPILSSVEQSRQLLRDFESQLPDLRRHLSGGQGWFEVFYVKKRHYKPEIREFARACRRERERQIPVPIEVEQAIDPQVASIIRQGLADFPRELNDKVYDFREVGPYVKYRWTEQKQTYTISLGLTSDYPPIPF